MDNKNLNLANQYKLKIQSKIIVLIILSIILLISIVTAISIGVVNIPFTDVVSTVYSFLFSKEYTVEQTYVDIITKIRLSRVLTGAVVGMSLGVSGAVMQTILQNPMASPFTLGVSSGASLGAAIAIIYPITIIGLTGNSVIIASAFLFSMIVCLLILLISARSSSKSSRDLILAGISIMYFFKAVTTLITYFSDVYATREIVMWQVGSLWKSDWECLKICSIVFVIIFPFLLFNSAKLNKMNLGDEVANSLGVNSNLYRKIFMTAIAVLTATVTAFTGTIGFVGLVVPHIITILLGSDNRFLLPGSAILGGILLVCADSAALNIISPLVLPVGVLTAFIGSPMFLYMILKRNRM